MLGHEFCSDIGLARHILTTILVQSGLDPTAVVRSVPVELFYSAACACLLLVACWAVGSVVLRHAGFESGSPIDRSLFGTAIGSGVISTWILVSGAVSLLTPWALSLLAVAAAWVAFRSRLYLAEQWEGTWSVLAPEISRLGFVVLSLVAVFLLLQSATPPADWDVLTYHLDVPAEFLQRGKIFLPADNHHVAFVGLQQMLYVPLLAAGAESGPAVLNAALAVLLALTMFAAGRRLLDEATGRLASVLLWGSPVILLVAVTARVDVTAAWFLLLSHYALVVCLDRREIGGWFLMAGLMAGFAFAVKYSALAYLAGMTPVIVWTLGTGTSSPLRWVRWAGAFAGMFLLTASPWLIKNTALFGAPLYPFFTEIQLEPWLASYVGSSAVPASVDPSVFEIPAQTREPISVVGLFTDPGAMTPEREGAFYFANFALLLLPLSLLCRRRKVAALLVPALIYVPLVLYPDARINLRYLIPALVTGTLVASWLLLRAGRKLFRSKRVRRAFVAIVAMLCLLPAAGAAYFQIDEMRPQEVWLGMRTKAAYLEENGNPDVYLHARARRWVNERLDPDDRVVMLFESRGYGFEPEVLQDNLSRSWAVLASRSPWGDCLASTGATHVLVNYGHLASLVARGLDPATVDWTDFGRFAGSCLEREGEVGSVVLYRIVS